MKIKVSEATPLQLDWLVAKCENLQPMYLYTFQNGRHIVHHPYYEGYDYGFFPTTDPSQSWPIIEREKIAVDYDHDIWNASITGEPAYWQGPTSLIAAMRCWVTSKMGEEVEVPDELIGD